MLAGTPPIRARKARYFKDPRLVARVLAPPQPWRAPSSSPDDWTARAPIPAPETDHPLVSAGPWASDGEGPNPRALDLVPDPAAPPVAPSEFEFDDGDIEAAAVGAARLECRMAGVARQASLDPDDGLEL